MMDEGLFKLIPEDEESKEAPWQSISANLKGAVEETLKPLKITALDKYEGIDLTATKAFEKSLVEGFVDPHYKQSYGAPPSLDEKEMKRIAELKGNVIKGSIECYRAEKLEKITLVQLELVKKYYGNIMTIWPTEDCALPILMINLDENPNASHFFVDCVPLADCVMDHQYLETYLDPFEPAWKRYKFVRDLPNFPAYEVNLYSWMRAFASPYLITRRVPPDKPKGIRQDLIKLGIDYLKIYIDLCKKAEPHDRGYMSAINQRKARIREHLRKGKDPDGNFWWKGEKYLGPELTHTLVTACY
jgi:hypothetical protein